MYLRWVGPDRLHEMLRPIRFEITPGIAQQERFRPAVPPIAPPQVTMEQLQTVRELLPNIDQDLPTTSLWAGCGQRLSRAQSGPSRHHR
jgi:hypothetical protein